MKAKLLRKVRKRYSIVSYPNGFKHTDLYNNLKTNKHTLVLFSHRTVISYCLIIDDADDREYRLMRVITYKTLKEGYAFLHMRLLGQVLSVYENHGTRRIAKRNQSKKLYLNNESKAIKKGS